MLALVGCHRPPTQEEISARAAELLAEQMASKQARTDEPAAELSEADKVLLEKTNAVLDETIIPRINFRDVTLKEAVAFLQQHAIEIARELPDRAIDMGDAEWKKVWAESSDRSLALARLTFFVKYDGFTVPPQYVPVGESPSPVIPPLQSIEGLTVTMDLSNISLREALQHLANLAKMNMKVGPSNVLFELKD
jgi:hypothetical protein